MMQSELHAIRNILTLRYNPEEDGPIKHKEWKDWSPTESDPDGKFTEEILYEGITDHLQNYDRIAISVSSGIDSSLILAEIRNAFPEKKIIAIHYTGVNNDELEATKRLAIKFEAELKILQPTPVYDRIPEMVQMMDSPKWDCYDYIIPQEASKQNCDVLVTGDGSDELYAGYTFRYEKFLKFMETEFHADHAENLFFYYLQCHNHDFVADQKMLFAFDFDIERDIFPYFTDYFKNPMGGLQKVLLADYNGKLCHNFMVKVNAFSEEFGIPIFSPFLTPEMKSFATHIPTREKYHNGIGKIPLRKICNRFGIEPPLKKLGFTHDIKSEWNEKIDLYLEPLLRKQSLIYALGIINRDWVFKNRFSEEERVINKLVSLYTLEKYLQWKQ